MLFDSRKDQEAFSGCYLFLMLQQIDRHCPLFYHGDFDGTLLVPVDKMVLIGRQIVVGNCQGKFIYISRSLVYTIISGNQTDNKIVLEGEKDGQESNCKWTING